MKYENIEECFETMALNRDDIQYCSDEMVLYLSKKCQKKVWLSAAFQNLELSKNSSFGVSLVVLYNRR